ncbi:hypothetical protein GH714_001128 [Hevea brasiliensis]|uniref:non-specific serine/threonine protein kinase n=1 Tax=Hevea brasiliensis TaxID=3981 RepID=A0A6A6KQ41_HEVBR|nr:hypothetical protein GH714_001128 [Hevea brasiliensis]
MAIPFLVLALPLILSSPFLSSASDTLSKGSSLSVENANDVLISPSGTFTAGFFPVGKNAYCFAIWFNEPFCNNNCTVVWMANRDHPVNGKRSELSLLKSGNLILTDADPVTVWATDTVSETSVHLHLQDSGNLALQNLEGEVLWQSFDFPADTLLPLQLLAKDKQLVSSRSQSNYSSGFFKLYFDNDNVLRLLYDGPDTSSIYWPDPELLSWEAGRSTYNNSRTASFDSLGNFSSSDNFSFMSADYGMTIQRRLTIDFDGNLRLYSREDRKDKWTVSWQAMSEPCKIHGSCGPNSICNYVPSSGRKCSCLQGFKMKDVTDWSLGCEPEFNLSCSTSETTYLRLTHVEFYGTHQDTGAVKPGYLQIATGFRKFTYAELKKATRGFREEIGRGAGGIVYKGILCDHRVAAIKRLINEANQGEEEFQAEVNVIGKLNHMNLIEMWGYCAEGKQRLLVYKYMEHGSLAENLSSNTLDWEKRFSIALGTAKACFLCNECLEWVLHCDVKPQNILLDYDYQPKVSDFGLSHPLKRDSHEISRLSRIRGTRGYIAPEWVLNLPITSKIDVYSYGMVLLEIVTGKSPIADIEDRRLVSWVKEKIKEANDMDLMMEKIVDPKLAGKYDKTQMKFLLGWP